MGHYETACHMLYACPHHEAFGLSDRTQRFCQNADRPVIFGSRVCFFSHLRPMYPREAGFDMRKFLK